MSHMGYCKQKQKWPQIMCDSSERSISKFLSGRRWNKHQGTNSSHLKKTAASSEELTVKLRGIAEVGMRQKEWWSVKMYWALSQWAWTAARLATAVSPDNSEYQEPARTCGEVLGRVASLLTAADWPLGHSRAASCSHIHHLPTCTMLLHAHWGRHYFFHFTPWDFSCQIKKMTWKIITRGHGRNNNNTTERSFCRWKLVLHPHNLSVINRFIAVSAFTAGVAEARIKLTLGQWEKACVLKDTTPIIYNFNIFVTAEDRPPDE